MDKVPCNARPTARPAAPMMATNDVVATPSIWITLTKSRFSRPHPIKLDRNRCSVWSTCSRDMAHRTPRITRRITHRSAASTTTAIRTFGT